MAPSSRDGGSLRSIPDNGPGQIETEASLRTYNRLLTRWFEASKDWADLVTSTDPISSHRAVTLRNELDHVESEIERIVDTFDDEEYDRVIRSVLEG